MKTLPGTLTLPPRMIVGRGTIDQLFEEASIFGTSGVLVHGSSLERAGVLGELLASADDLEIRTWCHPGGEPTLTQVDELVAFLRAAETDWVAAVGGGSVIDVAKAAAGLCHAPLPAGDYQRGAEIPPSRMPFLAAPTTAGTGSEATIVSVLTDSNLGLKKSIRHPSHMARTVILDGALLGTCPREIIAASGMDAFTQAIESYVSRNATWLTDRLALRGASMISDNLEAVYHDSSCDSTQALMEGSYLAGLALSNARLGLVHGLAHPLGARFKLPHGRVCAVCLPHVLAFNRQAIGEKYRNLCEAVDEDLEKRVDGLMQTFGIRNPFLQAKFDDTDQIIDETLASGSTKANPRDVTREDVKQILDGLTCRGHS